MKHQSFYDDYRQLHAKDIAELRRCLEAHGGVYDWDAPEHEDECNPIVTVGIDSYVGDVDVRKVWINDRNEIKVYAKEHDGYCEGEFDVDDIHFGHVEFIMDYMKEILTEHERELICDAACDLESGNHLLRPRDEEHRCMIDELIHTLNTPADKRDERQNLIFEEYRLCTDYDYAQSKKQST